MKSIWKFPIPIATEFEIEMPNGSKVLTVQIQNDHAFIWAIVEPEAPNEARRFSIIGTGNPFDLQDYKYIGTFQMMNGNLVWHLFEINK